MTKLITPISSPHLPSPHDEVYADTAPGCSIFDAITGLFTSITAWREAQKAEKRGDKEGFFDHLSIAVQKPASALNAIAGLGVKIIEAGSFLHWFGDATFIIPLSKAVSGLGVVLCISEIFLETIALKRSLTLESRFIHSPAPKINDQPTSDDLAKIIKWARKTQLIANRLNLKNPGSGFDEIAKEVTQLNRDIEKGKNVIDSAIELNKKILIKDLNTLNDHIYLASKSPALKAKLQRRLGANFVKTAGITLEEIMPKIHTPEKPFPNEGLLIQDDGNISSTERNELTHTLNKAQETLEKMHIQLKKRQTAYKIGILGASILLGGLVLGSLFAVCPLIPIALVLAGTLIGVIRFLYWTAYAESDGKENDLGKWANNQLAQIQEHILKPLLELIPAPTALDPNYCSQEQIASSINFGQIPVTKIE